MVSNGLERNLSSIKKIQEITNVFKEEMMLIQKAIEIEKEKGKAILQAKTKKLQELTKRSDELLNSLIDVENQRYTIIGELIGKYQNRLESSKINLTNFLQVINEIKKESLDIKNEWEQSIDDLIYYIKEFKKSAENLRLEVETNQKLLMRTKMIVSEILDKLDQKDKTYLNFRKKNVSNNALIVNQSV
jgi:hypothetical protein